MQYSEVHVKGLTLIAVVCRYGFSLSYPLHQIAVKEWSPGLSTKFSEEQLL